MIDEIPIEQSEPVVEETIPEEEPKVEVVEETPKKGRGRPKGSVADKPKKVEIPKVKPKVKPKAKAKKPKPSPIHEESESEEEEEYQAPQQPMYDTRAIASEVISMLSNRHMDRSQQKREKYRSWFQNPQY